MLSPDAQCPECDRCPAARFFLILTRAFSLTANICRSFVFVDQVCEVTGWLESKQARDARPGQAVEKLLRRPRSAGWGVSHSDYGASAILQPMG